MEVQVINNVGYIWNHQDVRKLRDKHRILGSFVGFSPKTFNIGLPFILLPEEMQLLKEKRIIKLYQIDANKMMRPSIIERASEHKEQNYQMQIEEFKEERIERIHQMADRIVEGKKRKLLQEERKKRRKTEEGSGDANDDDIKEDIVVDKESIINQEIANIKPITREMQVIQTFEEDPWLESEDKVCSKWSYPYCDSLSKCRLFTFKDLWNNNYYLTEGSKFGGDFLVYCGDPVKYHAKYVVICVESGEHVSRAGARVQDLVARCRLGTGVKKIILFSWLKGEDVKYKTLTRGEQE